MSSDSLKLLFVCTGNICRSPMAEGIAEHYAASIGESVVARSASLMGLKDRPADRKAIKVCREIGIDLSAHVAQPVTEDLVGWADYILVMELSHAEELREVYPELGDSLMLLGSFGGTLEIDDPHGGWIWTFRRCRRRIAECVEAAVERLTQMPVPSRV